MEYIDLEEYPMFGIIIFPDGAEYINRCARSAFQHRRLVLAERKPVRYGHSRILLLPIGQPSRQESKETLPSLRPAHTEAFP